MSARIDARCDRICVDVVGVGAGPWTGSVQQRSTIGAAPRLRAVLGARVTWLRPCSRPIARRPALIDAAPDAAPHAGSRSVPARRRSAAGCAAVAARLAHRRASRPQAGPAPRARSASGSRDRRSRAPAPAAAAPPAAPAVAPPSAPIRTRSASARTVEIDTTGGPGFGFEHFKQHDFLRDKEVVLTFDDGPWPTTPAVLKALAEECVRATFFPIGKHATYYPEILSQVAPAGHSIGSHTWSHQDLSKKDRRRGQGRDRKGASAP